ncbi:protein kinase, other [Toxoplasma gondii ME49]|uniref:Protein kinase, other n=1 Tax=Toxoplasma gondii (strain ATCC 50611 / Me49) TaxID=508771 RepID=S8F7R1_TOXGM|nr:protein kinase, other [Toxoplasma gondii ME49]EPT31896.1 protein kinase, other [Toxoplasma gondii ME49]|eukprot:XP_002371588.1 protein kinase, other [Toxoplasma gondii ME49]
MADLGPAVVTTTAPAILGGYTGSAFDLTASPRPGGYLSSCHPHIRNGNPRMRVTEASAPTGASSKTLGTAQSLPGLHEQPAMPLPGSLPTGTSLLPMGSLSPFPFQSYSNEAFTPSPPYTSNDLQSAAYRWSATCASAPPSHALFGTCEGASTLARGGMTRRTSTTMAASNASSTSAPAGLWRTGTTAGTVTELQGGTGSISSNGNHALLQDPSSNPEVAVCVAAPGGMSAKASAASAPRVSSKTCTNSVDKGTCSERLTAERTSSVVRQIQDIRHHYTMGRKLGSGYTASVYEAKCLATQQVVAIKDVDKSRQRLIACDSYYRAVYEKLAKLPPHRHLLLPPIALLETETHFYIVMERCHGSDMVEYVLKHPPAGISSSACKRLLQQLLLAVHALHSHNVLHRDIKLDNIMFRYPYTDSQQSRNRTCNSSLGSEVALIDFDMCLLLDRPGPPKPLTNANEISVVGTREYMAPECYKGNYSTASDMWSIGVILYVLIDGHFPFDVNNCTKKQSGSGAKQGAANGTDKSGSSSRDIRRRLRQGVRFEQRIKDRHPLAVDLIQRLLTYDPIQRLGTAYEALCHPWLTGIAPPMPRVDVGSLPALSNALPTWQFVPSSDQAVSCYSLPQQLGRNEAARMQQGWPGAGGPGAAVSVSAGVPERTPEGALVVRPGGPSGPVENRLGERGESATSNRSANAAGHSQGVSHSARATPMGVAPSAAEDCLGENSSAVAGNAAGSSARGRVTTVQQKQLATTAMRLSSQAQISFLAASLGLGRDNAEHSSPMFLAESASSEMLAEYTNSVSGTGRHDGPPPTEWASHATSASQRFPHGENFPYTTLPLTNDSRCREAPDVSATASALSFFPPKSATSSRQSERDAHAVAHPQQMRSVGGPQMLGGAGQQDMRLIFPGLADDSSMFLTAASTSKGPETTETPGSSDFMSSPEASSSAYFASRAGRSVPVVQHISLRNQTPSGDSTSASATDVTSSPHFFSSSQSTLGLLQGETAAGLASSRSAWRKTATTPQTNSADQGVCTREGVLDAGQPGLESALKSFMTKAQWQGHASVGRLMKVNAQKRDPQVKGGNMSGIPSLNYLQGHVVGCHLQPAQQTAEKMAGGARLMSTQQPPEAVEGV